MLTQLESHLKEKEIWIHGTFLLQNKFQGWQSGSSGSKLEALSSNPNPHTKKEYTVFNTR
jgi:hypothetical protein